MPASPLEPRRPLLARRLAARVRRRRALAELAHADLPSLLPRTTECGDRPGRPPVFVLSNGWRSGSTAVQRLVISGGQAFVWGEPFPTTRVLARLHRIALEVGVLDEGPDRLLPADEINPGLARSWLATTNPSPEFLFDGIRDLLETTYYRSLPAGAFATWGLKEVVATPRQIDFLRALYPDAPIVCLVRDPLAAYGSFREFVVSSVVADDSPAARLRWVGGPVGFADVWTSRAAKFRTLAAEPNVHVFRYEDIAGSPDFPETLGRALDMKLDPEAWSTRIGAVTHRRLGALGRMETAIVRARTADEAEQWGYGSSGR